MPQRAIRFLRMWAPHPSGKHFMPGDIDTELSPGVMDVLVNYRRVAEWYEPEPKPKRRDRHAVHP